MTHERMATYGAVVVRGPGGLDQLQEVRLPLVEPGPGQVRLRVLATGAGATDVAMRRGSSVYRPPFPFVPGYEVVGRVDALGPGVEGLDLGQRVCALAVHGGAAEVLVRGAEHLVPVPEGIGDAEAVALVLNYATAYQLVHRAARARPGQAALVTGATGAVGRALVELLLRQGVRTLAAASAHGHPLPPGAEPVEARGRDLAGAVRAAVPGGVDLAFDAVGGRASGLLVRATRRGGRVIGYGFVGARGRAELARGLATLLLGSRLLGRRGAVYGITRAYRRDRQPFREDLGRLFALVAAGELRPRIAARLPLLAVREAQALVEEGGLDGKVVLLADPSAEGAP
jgi:NADPH:quinone reductase